MTSEKIYYFILQTSVKKKKKEKILIYIYIFRDTGKKECRRGEILKKKKATNSSKSINKFLLAAFQVFNKQKFLLTSN